MIGKTKVIHVVVSIFLSIYCHTYFVGVFMRFLILLFSFIARHGFSLPVANVVSGSKAEEKPEMPQMAGITAKSIYKRGFS